MSAGRPTPYQKTYCKQVEKLCKLGATDKEISDFFDVVESTINLWKLDHPEFSESIKKGKIIADLTVAGSLFKKANGYTVKEVTFEKMDNKENLEMTSDGELAIGDTYKKKVVKKEVPPDTTAAIFWLKNRRGKIDATGQRWADKQEIDQTVNQRTVIIDTTGDDTIHEETSGSQEDIG
jgi:hypothetical protein